MSLLTVVLLLICTCAYIRSIVPSILDRNKTGWNKKVVGNEIQTLIYILIVRFLGTFWKCARIGERKSPYVAFSCLFMAFSILFCS